MICTIFLLQLTDKKKKKGVGGNGSNFSRMGFTPNFFVGLGGTIFFFVGVGWERCENPLPFHPLVQNANFLILSLKCVLISLLIRML